MYNLSMENEAPMSAALFSMFVFAVKCRAEGGGFKPQWLTRPLDNLSGSVQYPLETPSKRTPDALEYSTEL